MKKGDGSVLERALHEAITAQDVVKSIEDLVQLFAHHEPIVAAMAFWTGNQQLYTKSSKALSGKIREQIESAVMQALTRKQLFRPTIVKIERYKLIAMPLGVADMCLGSIGLLYKAEDQKKLALQLPSLMPLLYHFSLVLAHGECVYRFKQAQHEAINGMIAVIEALDPYTHDHSRNVANYALLLAEELKLPTDQIGLMHYAGLFHDVGKIGISPEILKKQGPLTDQEYAIIQQHPVKGANIMAQFSDFADLVPIILHHHEWINGKGYPDGLKGDQIPLGSRLVAVVDAYDAMTTNRAYRKAQDLKKALEVLKENAGKQFDGDMVKAFLRVAKNL